MTIDLDELLRRRKPEKKLAPLVARPTTSMVTAADAPSGRVPLVLDTNVYIADAAGLLPQAVEALLDRALLFHCSVCLTELAIGISAGDPSQRRWTTARDHYAEVMKAIPETRILTPDRAAWLDAGVLAGILARTQGLQTHQRKELLNDALIFLTATRSGFPLLTSNARDFDLIQQLAPEGLFFIY